MDDTECVDVLRRPGLLGGLHRGVHLLAQPAWNPTSVDRQVLDQSFRGGIIKQRCTCMEKNSVYDDSLKLNQYLSIGMET